MKKIILMGIPHHDNLGDVAIGYAEKKFIKENFPEYELICLPEENLIEHAEKEKNNIKEEDIIFLHGGGNFGNQYIIIENYRRKIIELFPNNKIIMFPQTIYFTENETGKIELEKSKRIYSSHKNLIITAREEKSLEIIKREFCKNRILYLPDIVTYLNEIGQNDRNGALLILRNDREKSIKLEDEIAIQNIAKIHFNNIEKTDISEGKYYEEQFLEKKLFDIFEKYRRFELVITDRLHGMIFAMITGTPCIALKNYNYKVESFYKWFENINYIEFLKNISDLENKIKTLKKVEPEYSNEQFKKEFNKLIDIVKE
ncbi:MAG: polysaccharide pyruvyl transferase family protein [Candidatus Scatovivens sp.]